MGVATPAPLAQALILWRVGVWGRWHGATLRVCGPGGDTLKQLYGGGPLRTGRK